MSESDGVKLDLEKVLDHYEVNTVTGRRKQMVSCPLHEDRTPSCSVDLTKGVWNCMSCGKAGDGYSLVMEKEGKNFVGARSYAADHGLEDGGSGSGDEDVRGGAYTRGRTVPPRPGARGAGGSYRPRWRRD